MTTRGRTVDYSALRTNQAFIIGILVLAFVFDSLPLVAFVTAVMAVGTIWPKAGLFKQVYAKVLRGRVVQPDVVQDNPQPHRFAQGFGAVVLLGALGTFAAGATAAAWVLVGLVVFLAAINLFAGFCAGCFLYYWLARMQVSGFDALPEAGQVPGMRPRNG